ncbi:MAG TPA: hypothetical protein VMT30_07510 [Candidatus Saccharimonadia bacterium]|nr:hypothetical protein [Candidatus Saccharimonadia bacterium]
MSTPSPDRRRRLFRTGCTLLGLGGLAVIKSTPWSWAKSQWLEGIAAFVATFGSILAYGNRPLRWQRGRVTITPTASRHVSGPAGGPWHPRTQPDPTSLTWPPVHNSGRYPSHANHRVIRPAQIDSSE